MSKLRYYSLLGLLCLLGLLLTATQLHEMPIRERLLHTVGDALLVAVFLALTVDTYLKKWLLKEASLDIFQFMLGFQLPRGVTDRIKTIVSSAALIRRDCELRWTLTWADEKKEEVWARLETTYWMENLSHEDKKYQQKTSALDPNDPDTKVEAMWCHASDTDTDYYLAGDKLTPGTEDHQGTRWIVAPEVIIPSRNRERGLDCKFGAKYVSRYKCQDDDQYAFVFLTLNVRVVVEAPPDLSIKVDPKADRDHLGNTYEYSRLFVDNESVTIRWCKEEPEKGERHQMRKEIQNV
jgi:hypothetical protein